MRAGNLTLIASLPDDAVLHAYVDGELEPGERSGVEAWLASNPEMRGRVESWRNQNLALHRLAGEGRLTPMPAEMARAAARLDGLYGRRRRWAFDKRIAAAVALTVAAGAAAAVGMRAFDGPREDAVLAFARQAVEAHRDYAALADLHTGAGASGSTPVAARLAGIAAEPPDLTDTGFKVAMHRILPRPDGSAAQILYTREDGKRVTLYLGPSQEGGAREFTFRQQEGGVSMLYWQSGEVAFSLIGRLDESALLALAGSVSAAIDQPLVPGPVTPGVSSERQPEAVVSVGAEGEKAAEEKAPPVRQDAAPGVGSPAAEGADPASKPLPDGPRAPSGKTGGADEPQET